MERLEMAHIKLEAALETSEKWQITDASLLRWRRKLKRAAQECNDTLHKCKQRILEDEQMEREVKNSSLPNRIVHATKSFVFSILNRINNELSKSIAQRFEWYANGAGEFLRFIELGGTPRRHMPFALLKQKTSLSKDIISLEDYPYLKAGITFAPHGSSEDILPANRSSEIAATVRKEQDCLHKDVALEQLEEIILPRAIDYFRQNAKAMAYQILWKSKHGFALIYVEKPCINTRRSSMRTRSTFGGARKKNYGQDEETKNMYAFYTRSSR
ncbi:uncharacterized protein LOC112903663 [Panicum hallii]|uniref:uncharacterized protein LOC112903663 n=1 Tax=Panicum hallii TaxID=206008 RepID=UPI000DF4DCEC|nr:uncharacterized protein LOC112903663 [Panicum hallii]